MPEKHADTSHRLIETMYNRSEAMNPDSDAVETWFASESTSHILRVPLQSLPGNRNMDPLAPSLHIFRVLINPAYAGRAEIY